MSPLGRTRQPGERAPARVTRNPAIFDTSDHEAVTEAYHDLAAKDNVVSPEGAIPGTRASLLTSERRTLLGLVPYRAKSMWPELAAVTEAVEVAQGRFSDAGGRLEVLRNEALTAPARNGAAVAEWYANGEQGPKPEPPDLDAHIHAPPKLSAMAWQSCWTAACRNAPTSSAGIAAASAPSHGNRERPRRPAYKPCSTRSVRAVKTCSTSESPNAGSPCVRMRQ
jgi:hypothetical protein